MSHILSPIKEEIVKKLKQLGTVLMIVMLVFTFGCSSGPSSDLVKDVIMDKEIPMDIWTKTGSPSASGEILDYQIVNEFTENVTDNGQAYTAYCYKYEVQIKWDERAHKSYERQQRATGLKLPEIGTLKGVARFVKQGDEWLRYSTR